jgi:hypothetical protein
MDSKLCLVTSSTTHRYRVWALIWFLTDQDMYLVKAASHAWVSTALNPERAHLQEISILPLCPSAIAISGATSASSSHGGYSSSQSLLSSPQGGRRWAKVDVDSSFPGRSRRRTSISKLMMRSRKLLRSHKPALSLPAPTDHSPTNSSATLLSSRGRTLLTPSRPLRAIASSSTTFKVL